MPEVLSVETEDDLEVRAEPRRAPLFSGGGSGDGAPWKLIVILGALALFAGLVGFVVFAGGGGGGNETPARGNPSNELVESDPRVVAVSNALSVWGKYAVSGDVSLLEGEFDTSGEQYKLLVGQSADLQAKDVRAPATVTLENPQQIKADDTRQAGVRGVSVWSYEGAATKCFVWDFVLSAQSDGGWKVLTIEEPAASTASTLLKDVEACSTQ